MAIKRVLITVHGRVQGVGFRYFIYDNALSLNLKGFVRNLIDGSVQIDAEGENDSVNRLISYAKQGPSIAYVDRCDILELNGSEYTDFKIK